MELISTTTLILVAPVLILLLVDRYFHYTRYGQLVDKIPGPTTYPIIGNALDINVPFERLWLFFRESARIYYPVYKFWILHWPVVTIFHPDDVEILLSNNKNINKSLFYELLHPWLNTGLLTAGGDKWRSRRKILTPTFHFNVLEEFVDSFVEHTDRLVETLKSEAKSGEIVKDLLLMFSKITLNTICETAMGTTLNDKDESAIEYKNKILEIGEIFYYRATKPWIKNDWIFSKTAKGADQANAIKILQNFTNKIIEERKEYHVETGGKYLDEFTNTEKKSQDVSIKKNRRRLAFLDLLISASKKGLGIDDNGIREEVDTFVFEGHDTTTMGLFFATLLLAEHKEFQARCREEVNEVMQQCETGKMTIKDVQKMTFLDRCIKESLRLFPSVPAIGRKIEEDIQLKSCFLPKGSLVNIQIFDTHRDPNFWPRPNVFDPDRFLPENCQGRHPFSYVPFSAGPRNCIGQKFALLELKTVLAGLLMNFYLEPMELAANVRILPDLVLRCAHPVHTKFIPINK